MEKKEVFPDLLLCVEAGLGFRCCIVFSSDSVLITCSDRVRIEKRLYSESPVFSDSDLGDVNELS